MATLARVREKAAAKLGLKRLGQSLNSNIDDDLEEAYTELYNELLEEGLVDWSETDDTPNEYTRHIVNLLAASRVDEYGVSNDRYSRIVNAAENSQRRIYALSAGTYTPCDTDTEIDDY